MTTFLALWQRARVALAELAGVALIAGAAYQWDPKAALGVAGLAALTKSVEWDLKRAPTPREVRE